MKKNFILSFVSLCLLAFFEAGAEGQRDPNPYLNNGVLTLTPRDPKNPPSEEDRQRMREASSMAQEDFHNKFQEALNKLKHQAMVKIEMSHERFGVGFRAHNAKYIITTRELTRGCQIEFRTCLIRFYDKKSNQEVEGLRLSSYDDNKSLKSPRDFDDSHISALADVVATDKTVNLALLKIRENVSGPYLEFESGVKRFSLPLVYIDFPFGIDLIMDSYTIVTKNEYNEDFNPEAIIQREANLNDGDTYKKNAYYYVSFENPSEIRSNFHNGASIPVLGYVPSPGNVKPGHLKVVATGSLISDHAMLLIKRYEAEKGMTNSFPIDIPTFIEKVVTVKKEQSFFRKLLPFSNN